MIMRKNLIRTILIVAFGLNFTGCLGGNEDAPAPTDSQTGNLPPPIYGTNPSPIDTESNVLGPWFFKSTNFELTRTTTDFTIGNLQPGRYKLKIQNGNYGPFLARTCAAISDAAQRKQCLYDNLIEKTTQEFTRTEKSLGSLNGTKLFAGKTLTRTFAYKEESVQLHATNQFIMDVQAFPTASLKMAIDHAEEFATPVALFSVNSLSGTAPATIKFNATHSYDADNADMASLQYDWNFGDGQTATGINPSHVYSAAGTYIARLKVTDQTGRFDEFTAEIFIKAAGTPPPATNKNPVLKLSVTYPDPENLRKINVSLANSYDTDGLVTAYSIDFSDGTKVSASEIEHTYAKDGTYLLKVTITDDLGGKASLTESLSISTTNDLIAAAKIYGTKTYYGDIIGERRITDTFQIPAQDLNSIYKLTIKNADGLPHDQKSCTGTSGAALLSCQYDNLVNKTYIATQRLDYVNAYLNGKLLTDSTAINKSNYVFSTIIAPQDSNTLEIRMKGFPTAYAQIYIEKMQVADNTPPILSLRSPRPEENYYSNQGPTNIQVVVDSNKVLTSGTINGVAAKVLDGNILVADVPFASAGRNQISVQATDLEGNSASNNFGFDLIRDQVAPVIAINYVDRLLTNLTVIDVPVTITDTSPTTTSVSINGEQLFLTSSKSFTTPITLPLEGENTITIQSLDAAGNASGVMSLRVMRDTTPPVITQSNPENNRFVESMEFSYSGLASEKLQSMTIAGEAVSITNDQFSGTYFAQNWGVITLNFVLKDLAGNENNQSLQVSVLKPLLVSSLLSIAPDKDGKHIWLIGANSAARPGSTVYAYLSLFGDNGTAIADANGAFQIRLNSANLVKVRATDSNWNQVREAEVTFQGTTTLAGTVKDVNGTPLPNVTVGFVESTVTTTTDGNGIFSFTNPPTGDQTLVIDATLASDTNSGPLKSYSVSKKALNIGFGQNNVLDEPIYLAPLLLDGTETDVSVGTGATVVSPHAPGVQLQIPAGATQFPDQATEGAINIVTIPANRALTPVPESFVPTNVIAMEPSGTSFSEPVPVRVPNESNLPANTPMVFLSMNSAKGKWELGGVGKVSEDGQSVATDPGKGIKHFSTIYAVPLAPLIAMIQNPNLTGIDASNGGLTNKISLPSFKILGQSVAPALTYKSGWAHPTALVSATLQIPQIANETNNGSVSGTQFQERHFNYNHCWHVIPGWQECRNQWIDLLQRTTYVNNWQATNMWIPHKVSSQFFVGTISSDDVSMDLSQENSSQIEQLNGTPISNAAATQILTQTGIPTAAAISYAIPLKDPSTNQYMSSGIHPALGRFQIEMQNLKIITSTLSYVTTTVQNGQQSIERNNLVKTDIDSELVKFLPQDLKSDILLQNKVQSNAGRGWQINGAQRLYNPTNTKVMLEEASGEVSTYAINNVITTLYNSNNTGIDLEHGVDLSSWPNAYAVRSTASDSYLSEINLTSAQNSAQDIGTMNGISGKIANQGYENCDKVAGCDGFGCRDFYTGTFQPKILDYKTKIVPGGIVRAGNGNFFLTNQKEHAFYSYNGTANKISGETQNVDQFLYARNNSSGYFNYSDASIDDACINLFGFSCTNPQPQAAQNCDSANAHFDGYYRENCQWYCNGQWWGCEWYRRCDLIWVTTRETTAQVKYADSTGEIGIPGNTHQTFNSPTIVVGDPSGENVYIADTGNNQVKRQHLPSGKFFTVAGNGQNYDLGDGGGASEASLYHPQGLVFDDAGNLYISTANGYIRKVDPSGIISTFAGTPIENGGYYGDQSAANIMSFNNPHGLAYDSLNKFLYVADTGNHRVVQINMQTGIANKIAGTGQCSEGIAGPSIGDGKPALTASLCSPTIVGLDDQKNLLIVDSGHKAIRRVSFTAASAGTLAYAPSNGDLSRLLKNSDGSWTRQYRNGNYDYFNQDGFQTQSADRIGRVTNFQYDGDKNLSRVNFPNGQYIQYSYTMNKLQSIVDPAGRMTSFDYAGENLAQVNFPDGSRRKFYYDTNGIMISEVDQRSNTTQYAYNDWHRLNKITKADGSEQTITDFSSQTVANGATDPNNPQPMKNPATNANQLTDAKNNTTTMTPDYMGFISEITDAQNNVTTIRRDFFGKPIEIKKGTRIPSSDPNDPPGTTVLNAVSHSTMTYDPVTSDLLKSKDEIMGLDETKTYDQYGNIITETNAKNQTVTKSYDPLNGLLMEIAYPMFNTESYSYNAKGQVVQKITQNGATNILTTYEYNALGQMSKVIDNGGKFTSFVYDSAGNQIQSISTSTGTDQLITYYEYDAFNRLTKVTSPKNEITQYEYLKTGELSKIIDPNSNITTFNYDQMGRLTSKIDPIGNTFQFAYDGNGNRIQEIDPNGNTKSYTYDSLNRVIQANFPDDSLQYQYDEKGEVIFAANSVSQINVVKDSKQRVTRATLTGLGAMSGFPTIDIGYDYDAADNRIAMSSGYGSFNYGYDSNNRLSSITNSWGGIFNYNYDIAGRLTSIARNGGNTNYTYTDSGALAKIEHIGNNQVQNYFEYFYDQRNFPKTKRSPAGDSNYSYDNNGQLVQATSPSLPTESFSYDALGNRTADEARAYGYDSKGQRLLDDGVYLYQYDGNGNVTSQLPKNINSTADAYRFTYSSKNQLIKTEVFAGSLGAKIREVQYVYDVLGRRMQKSVQDFVETSSVLKNFTRKYGYDGQNIFVEFDADNNMLAGHTHNPLTLDDILSTNYTSHAVNAQIAQYAGNFYYFKDHLGSIMDITDSAGNIIQKYNYKSFGKIISTTDASGADISAAPVVRSSFTYTGREFDEESGLYFYRARYYSANVGRFLQADPDPGKIILPETIFNKYTYARNASTIFNDPTGKFAWLLIGLISLGQTIYENATHGGGFLEQFLKNFAINAVLAWVGANIFGGSEFSGTTWETIKTAGKSLVADAGVNSLLWELDNRHIINKGGGLLGLFFGTGYFRSNFFNPKGGTLNNELGNILTHGAGLGANGLIYDWASSYVPAVQ